MSQFHANVLELDAVREIEKLNVELRRQIGRVLGKQGAVIGVSGGIDSSTVAALCCRALGPQRVLGVMLPETDSSSESKTLALLLAKKFGFEIIEDPITDGLAGMGCYRRRDEAVRWVFPEFKSSWKSRIVLPTNILEKESFNVFTLEVIDDSGKSHARRLPLNAYLQIVAATNLKQRLRMTTLYYHGERRNWAVVGTGNKDEHMQGFFVKYGDGGTDLKPIAHLFKIQVYQLARELGVPEEILERTPTTDTYSAEVSQEEFFFGLDFYTMDMLWYAMEHNVAPADAARVLKLSEEQVQRAYDNIKRKIVATEYLRREPLHIDE